MPILRVKSIKQIGRFKNFTGGGAIAFSNTADGKKMSVVLGDNTYGKSTLADIFRSANHDDGSEIIRRKTIPAENGARQSVELTYQTSPATREENITYSGSWTNNKLKGRVLVFDQEFIHKNIFTGIDLTRDNKENFTDFILGEEGVKLGSQIETRNVAAKRFPEELRNVRPEYVKNEYDTKKVADFIKLKVSEDKESLEKVISTQQKLLERLNKVSDFVKLPDIKIGDGLYMTQLTELKESLKNIKDSSYSSVSKEALEQIQDQLQHAEEHWLEQGTKLLSDNKCPYCTQDITPVKSLIDAYSAVFDRKYDIYVNKVNDDIRAAKQALSGLLTTALSGEASGHMEAIKKYLPFVGELEDKVPVFNEQLEELQTSEAAVRLHITDTFQTAFNTTIGAKKGAIHKKCNEATPISQLKELVVATDSKISQLRQTLDECAKIIGTKQQEVKQWTPEVIASNKTKAADQIAVAEMKIKRLDQDVQCRAYVDKQKEQKDFKADTAELQRKLEEEQSRYLGTLFAAINGWFRKLGSSDFELDKSQSRRGNKTVYELRVSFCGNPVSNEDLSKVFSESDRRNLALAIYLARAEQMNKANTILVLDDPVVSFDDNRIVSTCNELHRLSADFEQIVILTHYKIVIRRLLQCRAGAIYLKIAKDSTGARLEMFDTADFQLSDHEKAYLRLAAFASGDSNDSNGLRQFMERHISLIFQPKLKELGMTDAMLSEKISALETAGEIQQDMRTKLDGFRESLNPDHHNDPDDMSIEDRRNLTRLVLEGLYKL